MSLKAVQNNDRINFNLQQPKPRMVKTLIGERTSEEAYNAIRAVNKLKKSSTFHCVVPLNSNPPEEVTNRSISWPASTQLLHKLSIKSFREKQQSKTANTKELARQSRSSLPRSNSNIDKNSESLATASINVLPRIMRARKVAVKGTTELSVPSAVTFEPTLPKGKDFDDTKIKDATTLAKKTEFEGDFSELNDALNKLSIQITTNNGLYESIYQKIKTEFIDSFKFKYLISENPFNISRDVRYLLLSNFGTIEGELERLKEVEAIHIDKFQKLQEEYKSYASITDKWKMENDLKQLESELRHSLELIQQRMKSQKHYFDLIKQFQEKKIDSMSLVCFKGKDESDIRSERDVQIVDCFFTKCFSSILEEHFKYFSKFLTAVIELEIAIKSQQSYELGENQLSQLSQSDDQFKYDKDHHKRQCDFATWQLLVEQGMSVFVSARPDHHDGHSTEKKCNANSPSYTQGADKQVRVDQSNQQRNDENGATGE